MSSRSRTARVASLCAFFLSFAGLVNEARAEKVLTKVDNWEVYSDGRVGAFLSYIHGEGLPRPTPDREGHDLSQTSGGIDAGTERDTRADGSFTQGTIDSMRVRSGFVGNTLGLGVRGAFDGLTFTGYTQLWSVVEAEARRKTRPNLPDVRQAYAKLEGGFGTVIAGRTRALFSRGATDINALYAHRYGVGFPGNVDLAGPSGGHIGFGVLGSGYAAGLIYATPVLGGVQLTAAAFDPIQLQGAWSRTKWVRPEGELTFERPISTLGKFVLFGNGAWQKVYKPDVDESATAAGFGYGGRLELGAFHLGVAGHYGKGLGLNYALEPSDATLDPQGNLRKFDGYYAQSQVALDKVDLSLGWGITRVFLNPTDRVPDANTGKVPHSVIKSQMGISAGVVWHYKPWLHLDLDGFRADARWFLGEKQVTNTVSSGMTVTW